MKRHTHFRRMIPLWVIGFFGISILVVKLLALNSIEEKYEILVPPVKEGILQSENTFQEKNASFFIKAESSSGVNSSEYYSRRQYQGAPPNVPHPIEDQFGFAQNCLSCHQSGGYVAKYKQFAPIAPHPERVNCTQCHVERNTVARFRDLNWPKFQTARLDDKAQLTGPPRIPHEFHERNNCLSCHGGIGGLQTIRTSHPERINCRQCHVPVQSNQLFVRTKENL